jgi:hypothetical protein
LDADLTALAALTSPATKLSGIATGATANDTDANLKDRANHTGTQSADTLTDGTTNKAFLATERTKLTGIATGATANSADGTLLARSNHTGTQSASTISDFNTAADARISAALPYALNLISPQAYVSGNYYYCNGLSTATTAALGNGSLRVSPWLVTTTLSLAALFIDLTVAGDANSVFRVGIFADDGTSRPSTLVLDAGTISTGSGNAGNVSTSGTPGVYQITASATLQPGLYWVGGAVQGVTTTQPTLRTTTSVLTPGGPLGTSLPGAGNNHVAFFKSSVTGALSSLTGPTSVGVAPRIGYKVA